MTKVNFNIKHTVFGHIVLFLIFICALPVNKTQGLERIFSTYILLLMISYGLTQNWKNSFILALVVTLLLGLIDSRGLFSDYKYMYHKYKGSASTYYYLDSLGNKIGGNEFGLYVEPFELKPAGEGVEDKGNSYSEAKTDEYDNTNITDEDLDKILEEDEKQSSDENAHLQKAGGGLDQLKTLLDMAKKESPFDKSKNDIANYTPAQAQRATYHLIDTVKQLKETMTEMMPLVKVGKNLIGLHKQMGGKELLDAIN